MPSTLSGTLEVFKLLLNLTEAHIGAKSSQWKTDGLSHINAEDFTLNI